jgi:hypothetical protein
VLVELEGHGREDVLPDVELSQTVGWFTTTYPVVLPLEADAAATLIAVKERLRAIPVNGLHFGLLSHLAETIDACGDGRRWRGRGSASITSASSIRA